MPQSIPDGITREHVLRALSDLDAGVEHPFGSPTGYVLLHDGKRYAPKAVVGLAHRHLAGRMLHPQEFSGGEAPGQANYVLRRLGFDIVRKGEDEEEPAGTDWSADEAALLVADYFAMLRKELNAESYSKAAHRKALIPQLGGRTKGSIEFKHQNVSAVLVEMGLPYIAGYKPRGHYQALLADAVHDHLDRHPQFFDDLADAPGLDPKQPPQVSAGSPSKLFVPPPERIVLPSPPEKPWLTRKGIRIDFAERDARNRRLALWGEEFVVEIERRRLRTCGRGDLAAKVEHVSQTIGDGLGFDVLSFSELDEMERLIEVKTTALGKDFPFYVTRNEVLCSEDMAEQYQLYRVFEFARRSRLYVLSGALSAACVLEPVQYRAAVRGDSGD